MYNFALAFVICAVVYIIGEYVAKITKAWIPSVFVTAVVLLIGYWTVIPKEVVSDSMLIPFGSTIGIYLLITHMGTVISLKQLFRSAAYNRQDSGNSRSAASHGRNRSSYYDAGRG